MVFGRDLESFAPHIEASSTITDDLVVLKLDAFTWFELLHPKDLAPKFLLK